MFLLFVLTPCLALANDFAFSKPIVHDTDYTKGEIKDTIYLINLTNDTIKIDSIYLDTVQIGNGTIISPPSPWYGVYFTTFPLDTGNYFTEYDFMTYWQNNGLYTQLDKHIKISPMDSVGFTNWQVENTYFPVSKRLSKSASYFDTVTLELVFKTITTCDTLICTGIIQPPVRIENSNSKLIYVKPIQTEWSCNALGQRLNTTNIIRTKLNTIVSFKRKY